MCFLSSLLSLSEMAWASSWRTTGRTWPTVGAREELMSTSSLEADSRPTSFKVWHQLCTKGPINQCYVMYLVWASSRFFLHFQSVMTPSPALTSVWWVGASTPLRPLQCPSPLAWVSATSSKLTATISEGTRTTFTSWSIPSATIPRRQETIGDL